MEKKINTKTVKFMDTICHHSSQNKFEDCYKEWQLDKLEYRKDCDGECICGQKHITNLVHITNKITNISLEIGANCAEYLHIYVNKNYYVYQRNKNKSLLKQRKRIFLSLTIDFFNNFYKRGYINQSELSFLIDMYNTKSILSFEDRVSINQLFLKIDTISICQEFKIQ